LVTERTLASKPELPSALKELMKRERRLDRARFNVATIPLLTPALVLLVGLFLFPIAFAVYLGFTNLQLVGLHAIRFWWTGLDNLNFLLSDDTFYQSLWLTVVFVVGSGAVASTALGLVLALAMENAAALARQLAGALAIVAWTLPPTTIAIVWKATTSESGIVPTLLGNPRYDLLYKHAMFIVSAANAWSLAGLSMIMFAAALKNVPRDILEAARLEGASARECLFQITLPVLKSTIVTSALMMTLLTFGNFTIVYLMTAGGPGNDTNILPVYSYLEGFKFYNLGYSALLGDVIVIISALLGAVFVALGRTRH
jgi:multiple sugar transport system permease protein